MKITDKESAMKFLTELMTEIHNQDNRITACPYFFVIQDTDYAANNEDGEECCSYKRRRNVFLTEKAIKKHMEENKHHYSAGDEMVYLDHAWRNDELKNLLVALGHITGVPYVFK